MRSTSRRTARTSRSTGSSAPTRRLGADHRFAELCRRLTAAVAARVAGAHGAGAAPRRRRASRRGRSSCCSKRSSTTRTRWRSIRRSGTRCRRSTCRSTSSRATSRSRAQSVFYLDPHVCIRCRYRSTELLWQCPHCHEWNTFVEERITPATDTEAEIPAGLVALTLTVTRRLLLASRSPAASPPASRTVCERFAALGAPTIDADALAREAVAPGTPGLAAVVGGSGSRCCRPMAALDRAALGRLVFADATARRDLEAIIHPEVYAAIDDVVRRQDRRRADAVAIADIPLLYETGRDGDFDRVVVAACSPRAATGAADGARRPVGDAEPSSGSPRSCRSTKRRSAPTTSSTRRGRCGDGPAGGRCWGDG